MLIDSPNSSCHQHLTPAAAVPYVSTVEAYCQLFCDLEAGTTASMLFRSPELARAASRVFPDSCHSGYSQDMVLAFDEFYVARSTLLKDRKAPRCAVSTSNQSLPFLIVNWSQSLFDGACSPISKGFFDDDCMPGWDTWMALVSLDDECIEHGLMCWIPAGLVGRVDDAIRVDAAQCMSWLNRETEQTYKLVGWGKPLIS